MIYDTIDPAKIVEGEQRRFTNDTSKYITSIFYEDSELVFTLKNNYYSIDSIQENNYKKQYILLKSKKLLDEVNKVTKKFNIPLVTEVRASITPKTIIRNTKNETLSIEHLENSDILASISIPTFYTDESSSYLQIQLKEAVIVKESKESYIQYDIKALTKAI